ncbi:chemotaxis response regulator protein-glutamate methylesterase [Beggiatoa alba]|nr:chemotaxis response regulator protein-glutamate methylesterase [Beggiatoa alba]
MSVRVLVVDDSRFFRRRVTEMLESDPQIKVIDSAENGMEAVSKASRLKPDVITMDVEMPIMDGITATRKIMAASPTAILMFSSLTTDGARATLDALDAGAVDFLPKRFEDISNDRDEARRVLCERVLAVGQKRISRYISAATRTTSASRSTPSLKNKLPIKSTRESEQITSTRRPASAVSFQRNKTKLVAIGTSTGGPVALQNVLKQLPADFPVPIVLIQHMPGSFTAAFAERLNSACAITVREAKNGDLLEPGLALLAPGGMQMELEKRGGKTSVHISESDANQNYKPCVDITFSSVAKFYPGSTLAIVLTGMGSDGKEGVKKIKQSGSQVWVQDEATCVVYGMPSAIVDAGLADYILSLDDVGKALSVKN